MRLILWIAIFVSSLAGASYGYYKFRQSRLIAHPAFIEEFRAEARTNPPPAAENIAILNMENEAECTHIRQIDWDTILENHTFLNGLERSDIKGDKVWTLRLSLLAFLGMEYDIFEIEQLSADSLTFHRIAYSDIPESAAQTETQRFEHFRQDVCGVPRVRPLVYVASELGEVPLPLSEEFADRFMNQAEFRIQLGQRINKKFLININQVSWTIDDFLELMEQP